MSWEKAGKIASEAREYGRKLIKIDASLLEVTEKIEKFIKDKKANLAFPPQISLNSIAAHYCAFSNDQTIFKQGDIIKLDVGAEVDGCIGDTACTINLGNHFELVKASEEALKAAIKTCGIGVQLREIGKAIQETIESYGFAPIKNLSGHGLGKYEIHCPPTVPNYDNFNEKVLEENQTIAIEPFATEGVGMVIDSKPSGIYKLEKIKPIRDPTARNILYYISKNFNTLPFSERHLSHFKGHKLFLNQLEKQGILHQYSQLAEKNKGLVAQTEHSLLIGKKVKVLTE